MITPQVDIIFEASTPTGITPTALADALQIQANRDFGPIWGLGCALSVQPVPRPNVWRLIMLDDADQADALGYHELTPDGLPQAKVFVRTSIKDGSSPTVTASHELLEMLGDPMLDQTAHRTFLQRVYALEVCDAVEATTYKINGVEVSNFQTPAWFGTFRPTPAMVPLAYDFLGMCRRPWQLLKGGYVSIQEDGGWVQIFASTAAASAFHDAAKWRPQAREKGQMRRSTR